MNVLAPKYTMLADDWNRPSRHMRPLAQSGMPCGRGNPALRGTCGVPPATSIAVTSTGTDQTTKLASHEPTSGSTTGSVNDALNNSPTSRPLDQKPVARVTIWGNH